MPATRNAYTFKESLTMMAAKAVGIDPYLAAEAGENARAAINAIRNATKTKQPKDRAGYIREAQSELRTISAAKHPKLVNALQAKLLALQGRGGDTAVAHVEPGEMVIPRAMLTPEVMRMIAHEAQRRGIDPRKLMVGNEHNSINPATGTEEFGWFDWLSGGKKDELDMSGVGPVSVTRRDEKIPTPWDRASLGLPSIGGSSLDVETIPVTGKYKTVFGTPFDVNPTGGSERNDEEGQGWPGAPRGKDRQHVGLDITASEDQAVVSPIEGIVKSKRPAYKAEAIAKDPRLEQYRAVEIEGTGPYKGQTRILRYVDGSGPEIQSPIKAGDFVGRYQNRHVLNPNSSMEGHIHEETLLNGKQIDPRYFNRDWNTEGPKPLFWQ